MSPCPCVTFRVFLQDLGGSAGVLLSTLWLVGRVGWKAGVSRGQGTWLSTRSFHSIHIMSIPPLVNFSFSLSINPSSFDTEGTETRAQNR